MSRMKSLIASCLLCLGIICFVAPSASRAQSSQTPSADSERVMKALLEEVRQLRIALERINLSAYRAQIMVERMRAQQERVERLRRDLESVRNQMNELKLSQEQMAGLSKDVEAQMNAGKIDEVEYKMLKNQLEQHTQREQQLREREIQLNTELDIERNNLLALNDRLDALEREMAAMLHDDKSKQQNKQPPNKQ